MKMTNKKGTKRALLMSVLAMLMCVTMLVGSTFAWFTDDVTSTNNIIKSGTLDVEMYWAKGNEDPGADATVWTDASKGAIFNNDKWEPGYTEVRHIKISNVGTLALKYQLHIVANGDVSDLADVIDVYFIDPAQQVADRADLSDVTPIGSLADVLAGMPANASGNLLAKEDDTVTLALQMRESAGNEYQNKEIGSDFVIQLLATQLTYEEDSFDDQYDADAKYTVTVNSAAELISAIENVEDGYTIALTDNVTFDKDACSELNGWYEGIYYEGDKSFTIDLNGKTITNDSAVNDYLMLFKNAGSKANTITFKNGTLEAASSAYSAIATSTTSTQKITINLEDVNLIGNNSNGSVAKIRGGAVLNVKSGTVITGKDSYLGIENANATVNIYDGAEIYQNGSTSYNGCLVGVGSNGTVNVYGGYGKSVAGGFIAMTSGGTINVYGGEWIADTDGTFSGNDNVLLAQSDKASYAGAGNSVVNVYGGTFNGTYNCYGNAVGDAQINIAGGTFDQNPSEYVAIGCQVIEDNGTYTVKSNAAMLSEALAQGGTVKLDQDIVVSEPITVPAGVEVVLDLNGKTLNGSTDGALLVNNGIMSIVNGTLKNTAINGGATINNKGTLELDDAEIIGAPIASDAGYPAYCITNAGNLIVNDGTNISADRGCLFLSGTGETVINGGTFTNNDISQTLSGRAFTSHVVVVGYGANNKLTINDGTFKHLHTSTSGGVVINNWSAVTVEIKGGNFSGGNYFGKWDNLSDYGYGSTKTPFAVTGGTFTGMDNSYVADGYQTVDNGDGTLKVVAK